MRHKQQERGFWFYVLGRRDDGTPVLLGPYTTKEEADERGFETFKNNEWETHTLNTSDYTNAKRILKARILEKTGNLDVALKPMRYGK
jgi:hypothetical protein